MFTRKDQIRQAHETTMWDMIVIGGGATGLGIALDAASRGFATLLLEQSDFGKGTSSRSTKLVHGGVRYLAQGNFRLVYEALYERGLLHKNATHLVKKQTFVIPCYQTLEYIKYMVGLKFYDWMSGKQSFGNSSFLNKEEVINLLPNIQQNGLKGGVSYFDGQFDDARLAINLAQTAGERGAVLLNYCKAISLIKEDGKICGVHAVDMESQMSVAFSCRTLINATGVFVDALLLNDTPGCQPLVRPSQGIHLVINKSFLKSNVAVMIPQTADGRVLFAVPWQDHVLLGTTDTALDVSSVEPVAMEEEIEFILATVKNYLTHAPERKDVLSVFAGLRPLAATKNLNHPTKEISRDHKLIVSNSGMITITGGKWTTYRKMAEHAVNMAIKSGSLQDVSCVTKKIKIHGCTDVTFTDHLSCYGSDADALRLLIRDEPGLGKKLINHLPYTAAEVIWAVRHEMARTLEDVLARRLRILFLDAQAAIAIAPEVASLMQDEMKTDDTWKKKQLDEFILVANNYLVKNK